MIKHPHAASVFPASVLKRNSSDLPLPDVAGHDEWLLDEALAESFPASDSIAVSPRDRSVQQADKARITNENAPVSNQFPEAHG